RPPLVGMEGYENNWGALTAGVDRGLRQSGVRPRSVGGYGVLEPPIHQDPTPTNWVDIPQPLVVRRQHWNTYGIGFQRCISASNNTKPELHSSELAKTELFQPPHRLNQSVGRSY